jgi:hypothetical protein
MATDVFKQAALVLFLTTLPAASLVVVHNAFEWRLQPTAARQKRPVLIFTTALAVLAALTATLAFAAPKANATLVAPTDQGGPMAYSTFKVSSAGVGVLVVLFGAAALAMDGLFTLHLYRVGHQLEFGREPPRWKVGRRLGGGVGGWVDGWMVRANVLAKASAAGKGVGGSFPTHTRTRTHTHLTLHSLFFNTHTYTQPDCVRASLHLAAIRRALDCPLHQNPGR